MNTNEVAIEHATIFSTTLADGVRKLAQQLGRHSTPLTDDDLREILQSHTQFLLIARDTSTKQIAGMLMLVVYRIPYTKKAYMDDLIVDDAFRKRGIATQLLQKAITLAKEKHASYIDFTSHPQRVAGNALYEKLGFRKRETNVYRLPITYEKA